MKISISLFVSALLIAPCWAAKSVDPYRDNSRGCYQFREGQGTAVADESPDRNTASLDNGAAWIQDETMGMVGYFDGSNDALTIPDKSYYSFSVAPQQSFYLVFKLFSNPTSREFFGKGVPGQYEYYLYCYSLTDLGFWLFSLSAAYSGAIHFNPNSNGVNIFDGELHRMFVVLNYSGQVAEMDIDNVPVANTSASWPIGLGDGTANFVLGSPWDSNPVNCEIVVFQHFDRFVPLGERQAIDADFMGISQ